MEKDRRILWGALLVGALVVAVLVKMASLSARNRNRAAWGLEPVNPLDPVVVLAGLTILAVLAGGILLWQRRARRR